MPLRKLDVKGLFFIMILVLLIALTVQLMLPFLNILIVAILLVEFFHPLYKRIHSVINNKGLASVFTTMLTLLLVILPIALIFLLIVAEIGNVTSSNDIPAWINLIEGAIGDVTGTVNNLLASIGVSAENQFATPDIQGLSNTVLLSVRDGLLPITTSIISFSISGLFNLFLLIIVLYYTFIEYEHVGKVLNKISPLDDKLDTMLFTKFTTTTRAVIKGTFFVAIAQATAVSVMMIILGIGAPVVLWVVMLILSIIPVGSGLVWFPVGVILAFTGRPVEGVLLIIYSAVIINVIDTLLRPYVIKEAVSLHPIGILLSVLGGIIVFNSPLGIFYGPLILVFFTSLMHVYNQHFAFSEISYDSPRSKRGTKKAPRKAS